jgi:hypothetical protein
MACDTGIDGRRPIHRKLPNETLVITISSALPKENDDVRVNALHCGDDLNQGRPERNSHSCSSNLPEMPDGTNHTASVQFMGSMHLAS